MRALPFLFLFLLAILAPLSAHAVMYGGLVGGAFSYGDEGDDTETSPNQKRATGAIELKLMPGVRFYGKSILVGLLADFQFHSQLSSGDKSAIGDFGGTGLLLGPGVVFDFHFGRLLLSYDIRDRQGISQPDATLKGSGFHIAFGYRVMPTVTIDLEYTRARYNTLSTPDGETDLGGDTSIKCKSVGLGVSVAI
jgi:hypothetical protein